MQSPSLKDFIRRSRVLLQYRHLLREAGRVDRVSERADLRATIRSEFRRHQHVTDPELISSLLGQGAQQLKILQSTVELSSSASPAMRAMRESHAAAASTSNASPQPKAESADHVEDNTNNDDSSDERGRLGSGWPWQTKT